MAELETTVSADSEIEREVQEEEGKASWPYATLLVFGFFGTATPEGRRLARWTAMATVGAAIGAAPAWRPDGQAARGAWCGQRSCRR